MTRWRRGAGAGLLLGLVVGVPTAAAQYGEPAPTTPTTTPTTNTTTPTSTPGATTATTAAPEPATSPATISDATVTPGQPVTVGSPPGAANTFAEDSTVTVGMARGVQGQGAVPLATATTNPDGTVSVDITVPADTAVGVYYLYIVGTGPDGEDRVLVVPVTVVPTGTTATTASGGTAAGGGATAEPPPAIGSLIARNSLPAADEAAIVTEVAAGRAELAVEGDALVVDRLPRTGDGDDTRPLVAALAVGVAGAGLLLVRRSRPSTARSAA